MSFSEASFSGNANELTDYVLNKFPKKSIDPLPINVNTETIKIKEGELRGLSNVSRYGNCTLHTGDRETKIILELAASNLSSYFKYQVQTGLLTIKGKKKCILTFNSVILLQVKVIFELFIFERIIKMCPCIRKICSTLLVLR